MSQAGDDPSYPPTIVVKRGGSPTTAWSMAVGRPAASLAGLITDYGEYRERSVRPVWRREVGGAEIVMILGFAGPMRMDRVTGGAPDRTSVSVTSFVAGGGRGAVRAWHSGRQHCLQIGLTPLGAYQLLGVSPRELTGRVVPLGELWPHSAGWLDRLADAGDTAERFAILDETFLAKALVGRTPEPEVAYAWRRLLADHGATSIADLVAETGWTRARLATRFATQIGLTPKVAARALRFRHALHLLTAHPPATDPPLDSGPAYASTSAAAHIDLAGIAHAASYYDQPHFHRDFREFAGCTPSEWLSARLPNLPGTGWFPLSTADSVVHRFAPRPLDTDSAGIG